MLTPSTDPVGSGDPETSGSQGGLSGVERETLRRVALDSIRHGLEWGRSLEPDLDRFSSALRAPGAAFVTLDLHGKLRGCVGSFEARRPLLRDVAQNAYSAAFMDFRFSPLSDTELPDLELHISLLTPLVPLLVESREELLQKLRPGTDGLLLEDPPHKATFLPQVWKSLEEAEDFLGELFLKAGLPPDHWSKTLSFHRYGVEEF